MLRIALLLLCASPLLPAMGQQFSPYRVLNNPEAANVQDVAAGDLDNDGDADIVICNYGGRVAAYFNDGTGSFGPQLVLSEAMDRVYQVVLVDLDLDGDLDVSWAGWGSPDAGWCENLGGGVFTPMQVLVDDSGSNTACALDWSDVDEDGDLDLFVSFYYGGEVAWYRNEGDQNFGPRLFIVGCSGAWVCAAADMDADGDVDIVTAGDGISWRNNQNGSFATSMPPGNGYIASELNDVRGLVLRDPGDGYPDIFVAEKSNDRVLRYDNDGTGIYTLGMATEYATGLAGVEALRLMDLNGDGITEIVAACSGDNSIRLLYSNGGDGSVLIPGVWGASGMAAADFNGDGFQDLAVTAAVASQVSVFAGAGNFGFTLMSTLTEPAGSIPDLAVVDVDGDGLKDIVESLTGMQMLGWKRNLGGDQFGPVQVIDAAAPAVSRFLMRDMDNDGDPDLIASFYQDRMVWYRNEGGGTFSAALLITDEFGPLYAFDTGDFDGDGDLDLAAVESGVGSNYMLWMFANAGDGALDAPVEVLGNQAGVWRLISADVNLDGADEIISYNSNADATSIMMNDGAGNFTAPAAVSSSTSSPNALRTADLTGDGWPDLVIMRGVSSSLHCLEGNGDGTFTVLDTADAGEGISYGALDIADMDGDGDLDLVAAATNADYLYKWFVNDGTGRFPLSHQIDSGYSAGGWAADDLDGDGDPDLLTVAGQELRWYENFIGSPYSASGRVYYDLDASGDWSAGDLGMPATAVILTPSTMVPYSDTDGQYRFVTDPETYTLSAPPPYPWWQLSSEPEEHVITYTESDPNIDSLDFGFGAAYDTLVVSVTSTAAPLRCEVPYLRWLDVVNTGTQEATVVLDYVTQDEETIISSVPEADGVNGNVHRWYFTLPVFGTMQIELLAENDVMPLELLQDSVHAYMTTPSDTLTYSTTHLRPVLCAFDPNDKQVEPVGYGAFGAIDIGTERLTYTVRFQNTGTDTAFTVTVRDLLNERLDRSSIQVLGTSHPLTSLIVENNGEAVFLFDNILLPDSNVNEPASHGYVVFSIGVLPGSPDGTAIENYVDIYFGGNEAVRTNTVLNTLVDCSLFGATITLLDSAALMASSGDHYQWYLNGESLVHDTLQMILTSGSGMYTVHITNRFGCEAVSDPFAVISTTIAEAEGLRMAIVPNPMADRASVLFSRTLPSTALGSVVNAAGVVVRTIPLGGMREHVLERGDLPSGMYLLRVQAGSQQLSTRRFILQ